MEQLGRLVIDDCGKEYEFIGGGGGSQPAPDSVGSAEIKDRSVGLIDMDPENFAGSDDIREMFEKPQDVGHQEDNFED